MYCVFFFKQKTAYEMRISDWSSDVCSSDLTSCIAPGRSSPTFARSPKGCDVDTWKFRPQRLITASLSGSKPQRNGSTTRRSEERRVGKECVSSVDLGGRRIIKKKKKQKK